MYIFFFFFISLRYSFFYSFFYFERRERIFFIFFYIFLRSPFQLLFFLLILFFSSFDAFPPTMFRHTHSCHETCATSYQWRNADCVIQCVIRPWEDPENHESFFYIALIFHHWNFSYSLSIEKRFYQKIKKYFNWWFTTARK